VNDLHSIDYFCNRYELTNTDLAKLLKVQQPQIGAWKSGKRKIPEYHKVEIMDIFSIPIDKGYLLDIKELSERDRAEIELILIKAKLKHYDENTQNDEDVELRESVREHIIREVKLHEANIEILDTVHSLKMTLRNYSTMKILFSPEEFENDLQKVRNLINEIKGGV
jgi:transcriptional regulator with XRE-family HTH domain